MRFSSFLRMLSAVGAALPGNDPDERRRERTLRQRLLDFISRRPGVRMSTLLRRVEANRGTAKYHLLMMERAQMIDAVRSRGLTRFFPARTDEQERVILAVLRRGRVLEFVRAIALQPGVAQHELTARLIISRKVLRRYVDLLLKLDLVREVTDANQRRYYGTPQLSEWLDRMNREDEALVPDQNGPTGRPMP